MPTFVHEYRMSIMNNQLNHLNMNRLLFIPILIFVLMLSCTAETIARPYIRVLVITGGHAYDKSSFKGMLDSLGKNIDCKVAEFPAAFDQFLPQNRKNYDVLVFYHMWQKISPEQEETLADCIRDGKPLVVLHHSICAFDDWPEYQRITGGRYFHKPTVIDGKEYPACTFIHDLHFRVEVSAKKHPVTKGVRDFDIFDETYKGYYTNPEIEPLLTTKEKSSTPVIGWAWHYGNARVVTLQSGHDTPTYRNKNFRKLLRQAIEWSYSGRKL